MLSKRPLFMQALLTSLMLLILLLLVWFRLQHVEAYKAANEIKLEENSWRSPEPLQVNTHFDAISRQQWAFDFSEAEKILVTIPVDEHNQLVFNDKTAKLIEQLIVAVTAHKNPKTLARVETLIEKTLAQPAGKQLAIAVNRYGQYLDYTARQSPKAFTNLEDLANKNNDKKTAQIELFGLVKAQQLFGKKNRLNDYLLSRLKINSDKTLSKKEKERLLNDLVLQFTRDKQTLATSFAEKKDD